MDEITCSYYKVIGTHSTYDSSNPNPALRFEKSFDTSACSVVIMAGTWNVYVEGYNDQDLLIARSESQSVVIINEATTNKSFALSYLAEGNGVVDLLVRIPDTTPVAKVSFKVGESETIITSIPVSVDGYFNVSIGNNYTLPVGDYSVQIKIFNSNDILLGIPLNDRVHVYANLISSKTWTDPGKVVAPVITTTGSTPSDTTVSITTETEGASIYYTVDGSAPSARSTKYAGPFNVTESMTVKAIAVHPSLFNSNVTSESIAFNAAAPSADIVAGTYNNTQYVTLSCATEGASIRYTTDGTDPTSESTLYSSPISVDHNLTLKAVAFMTGYAESPVFAAQYEIKVADPVFSFNSGLLESETVLRLSCATTGSRIYYTLDGTTPTSSSIVYNDSGIVISRTTEVKAIAARSGCSDSEVIGASYTLYAVGGLGPAGGYIFYDCDADNTEEDPDGVDNLLSTICGWRFMEAAPADLRVVDGVPTVDSSVNGYSNAEAEYIFGYYRTSDNGENLYVDGTTTYSANCTETAIGSGIDNTQKLVAAMGDVAYSADSGSEKTSDYAARLCSALEYSKDGNTFTDWFLPSKDELNLVYVNLYLEGLGNLIIGSKPYWSSSENEIYTYTVWDQRDDVLACSRRYWGDLVRPVRAFSTNCPNGHVAVMQPAVEPTCGETGLTSGSYCRNCGHVLVGQEVVPATGLHCFESHVCTECGEHEYFDVNSDGVLSVKDGIVFSLYYDISTDVVIPQTVKGITVTSIANSAFNNQFSMTSVSIPDSVTSIGSSAFMNCTSLTNVSISQSSGLISIGSSAFWHTSITGFSIPAGVTAISSSAFAECSYLTSITIPNTVTEIGGTAFMDCTSLNSIVIPESVTSIGAAVFIACPVEKISVPSSVSSLSMAFNSYSGTVEFANGTTEIHEGALMFSSASNVIIPASVTSIASETFKDSTVSNIEMRCTTPPTLGDDVFISSSIASGNGTITVPFSYDHSILNAYENAGWGADIIFVETSPKVGDEGPAGGIIIYDCDADNDTGNADGLISSECKWRFIERTSGIIASSIPFCYKISESGSTSVFCGANLTAIGTGRSNTETLVDAMGEEGWLLNSAFCSYYAAKYVYNYTSTYRTRTFADWYLPSIDELLLSPLANCWSSSEYNAGRAYQTNYGVSRITEERQYYRNIVAVRYFSLEEPFGHAYECTILDAATCTSPGRRKFVCSVCGDEYTETYRITHDIVDNPGHVSSCSICGKVVRGPAGGVVFYDVDADNGSGNADGLISAECGWRYLEATPYDLSYQGIMSGYSGEYEFGLYSRNSGNTWLFVNGTTTYNSSNCTKTGIGYGKTNTVLLVGAMGTSYGYYLHEGKEDDEYRITTSYAAKIVSDLEYNGYSDWFVPSKDELNAWYQYVKANNLTVKRAYYLSSSEKETDARMCWSVLTAPYGDGDILAIYRDDDEDNYVRPVRQVLNSEL